MLVNIITYFRLGFLYYIPDDMLGSYIVSLLKYFFISFLLVWHLGIVYNILIFATTFIVADFLFFVKLLEIVMNEEDFNDSEDNDEDFNN